MRTSMTLWHSFACHARDARGPLPIVSRLLGHSRLSMIMRYAHAPCAMPHVSDELVKSAEEKVGAILAGYLDIRGV